MSACGTSISRSDWPSAQADGQRRLPLAARQAVHAGADQLGEDRAVVERQAEDDARRAGTSDGLDDVQLPDAEVEEDHHQQHGDGPEELDDRAADTSARAPSGESRPMPNTSPKTPAVTIEMPAALSVSIRPGSR